MSRPCAWFWMDKMILKCDGSVLRFCMLSLRCEWIDFSLREDNPKVLITVWFG